jgi:uncharacterized OB-fold protein
MARLIPIDDDHDTAGYFAAAKEHRLVVRTCQSCGRTLHLPRQHCYHCRSFDSYWKEVPGQGRLYSWTTVEHGVQPGYDVPFTIVLVELDGLPEVRLVGNLDGRPQLEAGMAMQVRWDEIGEGVVIPNWEPAP